MRAHGQEASFRECRDARFKRRALSNSYVRGATYCFPKYNGGHRWLALKYLVRAFVTDPANLGFIACEFSRLTLVLRLKQLVKKLLRRIGVRFPRQVGA